jgi:hypothetical protein
MTSFKGTNKNKITRIMFQLVLSENSAFILAQMSCPNPKKLNLSGHLKGPLLLLHLERVGLHPPWAEKS